MGNLARYACPMILAALVTPASLSGQDVQPDIKPMPRYIVKDLGTFGGPNSYYFSQPIVATLNNDGTVVGGADTTAPDPDYPFCFGNACLAVHAFRWKDRSDIWNSRTCDSRLEAGENYRDRNLWWIVQFSKFNE